MKQNYRKVITGVLLAVLVMISSVIALAADSVSVSNIALNEEAVTVAVHKSVSLKAEVEPKNASNKKLTWSSSDESIATVKGGNVTGVGPGTATITATADDGSGVSAKLEVTVIVPVKTIELSETKVLPLPPLVPWRVTAQISPEDATLQDIVWTSSDEKIANVDQNGTINGVSPGTATITAVAADGQGAKASVKVKIENYDVVFDSMESKSVEYTIVPGSHHIRGKVKNGNVSMAELDYTILLIGTNSRESVLIKPVKAGPDVVSITGSGRNAEYKVFVSPQLFPESGAAVLPENSTEQAELLFLNIPWGTNLPEARRILEEQGKKVREPAQRNDYLRAQIDGDISFSNCIATNSAMDFSYEEGEASFKSNNSLFKGVLYFEPETPFDQIRLAVRSVYGLDNGVLNGDTCTWVKEDMLLTLTRKDRYTILEIEKQTKP